MLQEVRRGHFKEQAQAASEPCGILAEPSLNAETTKLPSVEGKKKDAASSGVSMNNFSLFGVFILSGAKAPLFAGHGRIRAQFLCSGEPDNGLVPILASGWAAKVKGSNPNCSQSLI